MPELIDRQAVRLLESDANAYTENWNDDYEKGFCDAINKVLELPTIEPKRGRWNEIQCFSEHGVEMASYECTSCGNDIERQRGVLPQYCEFCGADMIGGADNAESD